MATVNMHCTYKVPFWAVPLVFACRVAAAVGIRVPVERVANFIASRVVIKVNGVKVERY